MPHESELWRQRADLAEQAVLRRHLRRLWHLPATRLAVVAWPPTRADREFRRWHYWWQAHLLDCMADAQLRAPSKLRRERMKLFGRGVLLHNALRWVNNYYDDMAWLALALQRADELGGDGHRRPRAVATLRAQLYDSWLPEYGAIPWRKNDDFLNTPANGPAAIYLARAGETERAAAMADWIDRTLTDPDTGLVFDGWRPVGGVAKNLFTYCQGVVIGAEVELARRDSGERHQDRVARLVAATAARLAPNGVIAGAGGGDGGLFSGILARYLALAARRLPGAGEQAAQARETARSLVLVSAEAAWANKAEVDGLPLFGPLWDRPARVPGLAAESETAELHDGAVWSSDTPERDLSVQLSGWMLFEAAATL